MNRGASWAKWDLHVHTPASYVHGYGDRQDSATWDKFVDDLEASTPDHATLGICDYLTVDGYERLLAYQAKGRLTGRALLPVVELRLTALVGHDKLRRINYHVLFSESLAPEMIRSRFLRMLHAQYRLRDGDQPIDFAEWLDDKAVEELGAKVREALPESEKPKAGARTDLRIGMDSINFDLGRIKELIAGSGTLSGAALTAIGKNEWSDISWNEASIAEKRHLICDTDFVLCAASNPSAYDAARKQLSDGGVNSRLLDASDAHYLSTRTEVPNRIGESSTWIKAEPSFEGLVAALADFDERVFVGDVPKTVQRLRSRPDLFIDSVSLAKSLGASTADAWFDGASVSLNPELVAVIGNKGSGKSALLDCIALTGGARTAGKQYSFLDKFRGGRRPSLASQFKCTLKWFSSGDRGEILLSDAVADTSPMRVHHLPQSFIEIICNEQHSDFEKQLEAVIFGRIPASETHGKASFTELRDYLADGIKSEMNRLRALVREVNAKIDLGEQDLEPTSLEQVRAQLRELRKEFASHLTTKPVAPAATTLDQAASDALAALEARVAELKQAISDHAETRATHVKRSESVRRLRTRLREVQESVRLAEEQAKHDLTALSIVFSDLVKLNVSVSALDVAEKSATEGIAAADKKLDPLVEGSLAAQLATTEADAAALRDAMAAPDRLLAVYRQQLAEWRARYDELVGEPSAQNSIRGLAAELRRRCGSPAELERLDAERESLFRQIHAQLVESCRLQERLHKPVDDFVKQSSGAQSGYSLTFGTRLSVTGMETGFLKFVNKQRAGSFRSAEGAVCQFQEVIGGVDFGVEDEALGVVQALLVHLRIDSKDGSHRQPRQQVDDVAGMYDYLFGLEYLKADYELKFNGRGLADLSPGEKGALLLIFYLLVDSSEMPLLIDQPEENLDNQSIYEMLVPYLREASHRRQVIIVTHNPNIAVACNADQIISCSMDKSGGSRISYAAGALEEPSINGDVVDILEGTLPAFNCRDGRYEVTRKRR